MAPNLLTTEDMYLILNKLSDGKPGYSEDPKIAQVQTRLSIMLQAETRIEEIKRNIKKEQQNGN